MTHLTGNEKGYMALKTLAADHVRDNLAVYEAFAVIVNSSVDALLENLEGNKVWATSNEMVVVATLLNRPIWSYGHHQDGNPPHDFAECVSGCLLHHVYQPLVSTTTNGPILPLFNSPNHFEPIVVSDPAMFLNRPPRTDWFRQERRKLAMTLKNIGKK